MPTSTTKAPQLTARQRNENALWHALEKEAKRHTNRDALVDGAAYTVVASISGKVGRAKVEIELAGELTVGQENPTGSSQTPPPADVLAHVLALVPQAERSKVCGHLQKQLASPGELKDPPAELLALAKQVLGELKAVGPKRGAVQFKPAAA